MLEACDVSLSVSSTYCSASLTCLCSVQRRCQVGRILLPAERRGCIALLEVQRSLQRDGWCHPTGSYLCCPCLNVSMKVLEALCGCATKTCCVEQRSRRLRPREKMEKTCDDEAEELFERGAALDGRIGSRREGRGSSQRF